MKSNRIVYFDYLRIISVFSVVLLHVSAQGWYVAPINSIDWNIYNAYNGVVRWCVPVFIMISGALFLGKEQKLSKLIKKNINRIMVILAFWSIVYALSDLFLTHRVESVSEMVQNLFTGHYHLWFLFMIVGLYLIVPFLNKIIENERLALYYVILAFVIGFFIPQFAQILSLRFETGSNIISNILDKVNIHFVVGYSGYFVLGFLLNKKEFNKKWRRIFYALGICGVVFTIVATSLLSSFWKSPTGFFSEYKTVNVFFASSAVFLFAKRHFNKPLDIGRKSDVLIIASKCSLGIYLVYPLILEFFRSTLSSNMLAVFPVLTVPVIAIALFLASFAVSFIISRVPIVNRWIV